MINRQLSLLLIGLLLLPPQAEGKTSPKEKAASMEPGTRIEVTLLAGGKVNGRLGKVSERTLELLPVKSAVDGPRVLEWDSVSGVKNLEKRMSRGVYVLIGVGIAVGALAAIGYGLLRGFGR